MSNFRMEIFRLKKFIVYGNFEKFIVYGNFEAPFCGRSGKWKNPKNRGIGKRKKALSKVPFFRVRFGVYFTMFP